MMTMEEATAYGSRLEQLENLAIVLAENIDKCIDIKSLAQLSKQYRETIKEISELKGVGEDDDEIGNILSSRIADGKSGSVR